MRQPTQGGSGTAGAISFSQTRESATRQEPQRFIGIDAGAETLKLIELVREAGHVRIARRETIEHGKQPGPVLLEALRRWNWDTVTAAAATGRFSAQLNLPRIPVKQALLRGYNHFFNDQPAVIVNIGSHGFSVLEIRDNATTVFRENSRCSQGTGNFLRQLVERFSLTVEEASTLCADVPNPAPLSGRCPVILKTDMTHLANKGEDRARILAGLFDAVCENVLVLVKPGSGPRSVLLTGGVSRSPRVRRVFGEMLARQGMTMVSLEEDSAQYLEALGCTLIAADQFSINHQASTLDHLLLPPRKLQLESLPPLTDSLPKVKRLPTREWAKVNGAPHPVILGFDIGSTGSKLVAMDLNREIVWEGYRQTLGNPVGASQDLIASFLKGPAGKCAVLAFGATGSGREIAGSLLTSCYGKNAVFIVNEIVAHATGALHFDPRVDTIFEIGGQDAKYIRLAEGRIVDCAMNEACSAGTGSFIEEQGKKFSGIADICQLGRAALDARGGVSLGQHCSVFMAEVIDEAVGAGVDQTAIISGLYDSIIKNYLNRVKGSRSVGKVVFCQGMPFSADALAAAVARQTGSEVVVPPNPGTVGALGIALLAARELRAETLSPVDPQRFLAAAVEQKDTFVCGANIGCGGPGNHCRIERIRTVVSAQRSSFTWGGGCSLHDKGTRKKKLPDLAPDPFREREELLEKLIEPFRKNRGRPRIALSDEFMLKGLFPFFTAYLHHAGFDLEIIRHGDAATLKVGIQSAAAPFCAPMQLFHGVAKKMAGCDVRHVFVPRIRSMPGVEDQRCAVICPVVQAAPDILDWTVCHKKGASNGEAAPSTLSPVIDCGCDNLKSKDFVRSCDQLGTSLGLTRDQSRQAWQRGVAIQSEFDSACREIGRRALAFCKAHDIVPVVVLGRSYTIYNQVLNSNVPAILREQGAIGIPVDCYPVTANVPLFGDMYWGYGQNILRAAHQARREPGVYALYCSNYSCGPDSFNLHFAAYIMAGKPFAIIETDGHSGDAGTKTRVEAFLHCVHEDRLAANGHALLNDFSEIQSQPMSMRDIRRGNGSAETVLIPHFGRVSEAVAAVLRGLGMKVETLAEPNAESMRLGRRYTSGKECLPMPLTLGCLLQRLNRATPDERFVYLITSTDGPCRFGVYNLLNQIVLDQLGWSDRLRIWSPKCDAYFDGMSVGAEMLIFTGLVACDLLLQARLDTRPVEKVNGAANDLYEKFSVELLRILEHAARDNPALAPSLWQVAGGKLFGVTELLRRAAVEFAAIRSARQMPVVELAGEIYVRVVSFSNDWLIEKLEERGLRVYLSPKMEWVDYCANYRKSQPGRNRVADGFSDLLQHRIESTALAAMAQQLGWHRPPATSEALDAATPYVNPALDGEAVLTVGAPLWKWRRDEIDGLVSVGPLECMPGKIAEAQLQHVAEKEGLLSLSLSYNGDPINTAVLDNFAYEVHARFNRKHEQMAPSPCPSLV